MSDIPDMNDIPETPLPRSKRIARNRVLGCLLVCLAVLFFILTIVRLGAHS